MNRPKIGYLTFGRDDFSYGLSLCLSRVKDADIYRVTPKTAKYVNYLLFSCFWWEHIYNLAEFLRRAGIKKQDKNRPVIIVGGFNTFNPVPFGRYADYVICGDGERVLPLLIKGEVPKGIYTEGAKSAHWFNEPEIMPFSLPGEKITRIEISRGCKFKCKFCAVSHLKPYRELDLESIRYLLKNCSTKQVSLFSPEPTMHSQNDAIHRLCVNLRKTRIDSDSRLDRLDKKHQEGGVPRVGIEGFSERLRKYVGKPYSNDYIVEQISKAVKSGLKGLFAYFIMDLPGETEEDRNEFRKLLEAIDKIPGIENFMFKPSPSVFMPSPHTPLEFEPINHGLDCAEIWKKFFSKATRNRDEEGSWNMILVERSRIFSPANRVLSMLSTRAGDEFFDIEQELTAKKILKYNGEGIPSCQDLPGLLVRAEKYCGRIDPAVAPWKVLKI